MKRLAKYSLLLGGLFVLALTSTGCSSSEAEQPDGPYEPTWESLARYEAAPEWFRDAKFGIYLHWGVYTVPAFGHEWYPRTVHERGSAEYEHHVATYGPLSEFGYHDFVPMFTAEHYDPAAWADLFEEAGARFAGMVAEHHDGFSMWDSAVNPWNAVDKGPHRDLVGALEREIHGRGLPFVTTFHMARNLQIYADDPEAQTDTSYFPYDTTMATSSTDPELRVLYGNIPPQQFYDNWLGKLKEVIDGYQPDLIYFDGVLNKIPEDYQQQFLAYYLNQAHDGGRDVVVTHKNDELPRSVSVPDYEKGRMNEITPEPWLTDETVSTGSWGYTEDLQLKPARDIVHVLVDIVSKNGVLMLNVSPRSDGIIPQEQQDVLRAIGRWMDAHDEAIYGTRPWLVYGEGPTELEAAGHFLPHVEYTAEDVRYTAKGDTVHAIALGRPEPGTELVLGAFAPGGAAADVEVTGVSLQGTAQEVAWERRDDGLALTAPDVPADAMAVVFELQTSTP